MYHKLESDLKTWSQFQLSWLGRIHSKMTLLPRLLYLFRSLPVPVRRDHLKSFQGKVIRFVWGKNGYRFAQRILFSLKSQGWLGLPNLLWYYQVARLAQLSTVYSRLEKPNWICIKKQVVPTYTLDFFLWYPWKSIPPVMSPTLFHSLTLWDNLWHLP